MDLQRLRAAQRQPLGKQGGLLCYMRSADSTGRRSVVQDDFFIRMDRSRRHLFFSARGDIKLEFCILCIIYYLCSRNNFREQILLLWQKYLIDGQQATDETMPIPPSHRGSPATNDQPPEASRHRRPSGADDAQKSFFVTHTTSKCLPEAARKSQKLITCCLIACYLFDDLPESYRISGKTRLFRANEKNSGKHRATSGIFRAEIRVFGQVPKR